MANINNDKTDRKPAFLKALKDSKTIAAACDSVKITRRTYLNWRRDDKEFDEAVWEIEEAYIDHVESKRDELINGVTVQVETKGGPVVYERAPDPKMISLVLQTLGKNRGYVTKTEVEQTNVKPYSPPNVRFETDE